MHSSFARDQIKNTVKEAADIVEVVGEVVELKRAGQRLTGLCPFHGEKTPSFTVNPQGQFYHCFGCGEHGDVFAFVMKYHHMEFPEALKTLGQRYGIEMADRQLTDAEKMQLRRREQLYEANEAAAVLYQQSLLHPRLGKLARAYLEQRGVPTAIVERYRLGCAPDPEQVGWSYTADQLKNQGIAPEVLEKAGLLVVNERGGHYDRFRLRIMFPILDMTGRVAAFGGRILGDGKPKYMNSPETPIFDKSRLLFGLYQHREAIRKRRSALVVEGNFDLLLLAVHGIDQVVAPLGTALTREHVRALRTYSSEAVLLFDADLAGLKAAMRSIPFFLAEQVDGRVAVLPAGHDPDSFVRAEGPAAVAALVEQARPLAEFAFDALVREHSLSLAGKSKITVALKTLLKEAADSDQHALMAAHFSAKLGVSPGYFMSSGMLPQTSATKTSAEKLPLAHLQGLAGLPKKEQQFIDFLIVYPQYCSELQQAGLQEVFSDPGIVQFVQRVEAVTQDARHSERLLDCADNEHDQAYIAQVLTREMPSGDHEEDARRMCDELVQWLRASVTRQSAALLQDQINQAEGLGDTHLLMDLLRRKQELQQKQQKKRVNPEGFQNKEE